MYRYILLWVILPFASMGQDSTRIKDLDAVTVTANISASEIRKTARNVTVIDRRTIENAPVKTLDGILQYALNVDVRSRSAFGVQADISIRGGHYDQTLVLVDGVKMNDPQTGHHSLNLPVPLQMIEKIEILQGGASRVFGPSAFSGVINIITRKPQESGGSVNLAVGQHKLMDYGTYASLVLKKFITTAAFDMIKSNGHAYNTAFEKMSGFVKVEALLKNGSVDLQGGLMQNDFGASNFYSPKFYDQYEKVEAGFLGLNWNQNLSNTLHSVVRVNWRRHHDLYDFNKYLETNLPAVNFHRTDVWDAEWKIKKVSKLGRSAAGAEWRSEAVLSNRLGDVVKTPVRVQGYDSTFYTRAKTRSNVSLFAEHQVKAGKFNISGGTMLNLNSQFGTQWFPGVDIAYPLGEVTTLYSSINRSLRFPTFTELYLNTATVKGDPDLKPEKALTYELGVKQGTADYNGTLSVFYRQTQDAIDKIKRPDQPVPVMENINNINMFGVEVSTVVQLEKYFRSKALKQLTMNYAYLNADRKEEGFQSFYTLNYLSHKFSAGLNLELIPGLSWDIWYTLKIREGNYQWDAQTPAVDYKPVKLVDTRLSYSIGKVRLFADINNVFNQKYFEHGFVEQPGFWFTMGMRTGF